MSKDNTLGGQLINKFLQPKYSYLLKLNAARGC